jgi:hypothetical protein
MLFPHDFVAESLVLVVAGDPPPSAAALAAAGASAAPPSRMRAWIAVRSAIHGPGPLDPRVKACV